MPVAPKAPGAPALPAPPAAAPRPNGPAVSAPTAKTSVASLAGAAKAASFSLPATVLANSGTWLAAMGGLLVLLSIGLPWLGGYSLVDAAQAVHSLSSLVEKVAHTVGQAVGSATGKSADLAGLVPRVPFLVRCPWLVPALLGIGTGLAFMWPLAGRLRYRLAVLAVGALLFDLTLAAAMNLMNKLNPLGGAGAFGSLGGTQKLSLREVAETVNCLDLGGWAFIVGTFSIITGAVWEFMEGEKRPDIGVPPIRRALKGLLVMVALGIALKIAVGV